MSFELDGDTFEVGTLNAFEQLKLLRKLAAASPILQQMVAPENAGKDKSFLVMFALSQVSDDDMDILIKLCLKDTRVFRDNVWGNIITKSGGLMYSDIKLVTLLRLITHIFEENLSDFFHTTLDALGQYQTEAPQNM